MKYVALCIFLMMVNLSFAEESPEPSPSLGKERRPVQNPSNNDNQETRSPDPDAPSKEPPPSARLQGSTVIGSQDVYSPSDPPGESSSDDRIVWLTAGLLVVTFVQACIYFCQARLMHRGLELTRISNEAAQKSAAAALKSAEVAEAALRVTQRADVVIGQWSFYLGQDPTKDGVWEQIEYWFSNIGQTPATLIRGPHD